MSKLIQQGGGEAFISDKALAYLRKGADSHRLVEDLSEDPNDQGVIISVEGKDFKVRTHPPAGRKVVAVEGAGKTGFIRWFMSKDSS